jgi:uncharacterized cysteine cluster protein YcgN (CxxCxxCC family)
MNEAELPRDRQRQRQRYGVDTLWALNYRALSDGCGEVCVRKCVAVQPAQSLPGSRICNDLVLPRVSRCRGV